MSVSRAGLLQDVGEQLEAAVTDVMSVRVVDGLEVVQVCDDHRVRHLGLIEPTHVLVHGSAVGQRGERIGARGQLPLRQVSNHASANAHGGREGLKQCLLTILERCAHELDDTRGLPVHADRRAGHDGVVILEAGAPTESSVGSLVEDVALPCSGAAHT